jgi:hypothetical protein
MITNYIDDETDDENMKPVPISITAFSEAEHVQICTTPVSETEQAQISTAPVCEAEQVVRGCKCWRKHRHCHRRCGLLARLGVFRRSCR